MFQAMSLKSMLLKSTRRALLCALLAGTAQAGALFSLSQQGFASAGQYTITLSEQAFTMQPGEVTDLPLPGTPYQGVLDRIQLHSNGDRTWVGHLLGLSNDYRVFVTRSASGSSTAYGRILTPTGTYQIEPASGNRFAASNTAMLTDLTNGGWQRDKSLIDDGFTPPVDMATTTPPQAHAHDHAPAAASHAAALPAAAPSVTGQGQFAAGETIIDVLVLYTPDLVKRYGSAETLINTLTELTNQAYIDSQVLQRIRIVKIQEVSYTVLNSNTNALNALTNSTDAAFSNVASLRTQFGADLVALVRPYDRATAQGCGVAWVNGGSGTPINTSGRFGFSVTSYGSDIGGSRFFCDNLTFAHELGHNMGATHDRGNSSNPGAFLYSYGYGIEGQFGTVMSYIDPVIGKFSSPSITCNGSPCGRVDSEDNVRTFNNTRSTIAAFRAATVAATPSDTERIFNWAQSTFPQFFSPANSNALSLDGFTYRFYNSTVTYLGEKGGRLYFLDGRSGAFSDLGVTGPYLDSAKQAGF